MKYGESEYLMFKVFDLSGFNYQKDEIITNITLHVNSEEIYNITFNIKPKLPNCISNTSIRVLSKAVFKQIQQLLIQYTNMKDQELLKIYMQGFNDELSNYDNKILYTDISLHAYTLGQADALVGDDVKSIDTQTSNEILNRIKQWKINH